MNTDNSQRHSDPSVKRPRVVIIGAGFAGLATARSLSDANADIILIDRRNHHLFQPLLYQVATAALSPAQIAQPIRAIVKKQRNCTVALGEVIGIDTERKTVRGHKAELSYDYLVIATGATHTYFGHEAWRPFAPGLKSIDDALLIRRKILDAFEKAELSVDPDQRSALLTFVLIGGGPTGVEMAGAIAELARHTLSGEFRRIDPAQARVILVEAGKRILPSFPEKLSKRSQKDLEHIGVQVITGQAVTECTDKGIMLASGFINSRTILWCAGVKASAAAAWLQAEQDKVGRVLVNPDLSVPGHSDIFVIGDTAHVVDTNGVSVPGLAPAAEQQGSYVARLIQNRINKRSDIAPFIYADYGTMATIGRGKAVADIRNVTFTGLIAWILWGVIHLMPLVGFRNRIVVALDWFWSYLTRARGVRLITSEQKSDTDI